MSRQNHAIHICTFVHGWYRVRSASGAQVVHFEESDRFGPSLVDMATLEIKPVPDKHWFWKFYTPWREAGRPTEGPPLSTPGGPLQMAIWAG